MQMARSTIYIGLVYITLLERITSKLVLHVPVD